MARNFPLTSSDTFDVLYAEGEAGSPKMMSSASTVALSAAPAAITGLENSSTTSRGPTRSRLPPAARHCRALGARTSLSRARRPSVQLDRDDFVTRFGASSSTPPGSPNAPATASSAPLNDTALGLHFALTRAFRMPAPTNASPSSSAHPDLAGKLAAAKRLTAEASPTNRPRRGLDALTDAERARFTGLNTAYRRSSASPSSSPCATTTRRRSCGPLRPRLANDPAAELATALPRSNGSRSSASRTCCHERRPRPAGEATTPPPADSLRRPTSRPAAPSSPRRTRSSRGRAARHRDELPSPLEAGTRLWIIARPVPASPDLRPVRD